MNILTPAEVCVQCETKKMLMRNRCPVGKKILCPRYRAALVAESLKDEEVLSFLSPEILAQGIQHYGYTGELRKIEIVRF